MYGKIKAAKGITEKVGYELQKDESTVPGASEYNQRLDSIVGFCGKKGAGHECDDACCIWIGEDDKAYDIIHQAHDEQQLAGYLALVVVVPLDERLPRITLVAHATCNRFTAVWQRRQWQRMEALANELVSPHLGWLEGHGSDGDERRAKLMKQDMCMLPTSPGRFGLDVPGFTMSAKRIGDMIVCMHAQDPRHNVAKLYSHLDSSTRYLEFGNARATHEHVRTAWEIFAASELHLPWTAVQRDDRMDKAGPARCAGRQVRDCLSKLAAGDAGGAQLKPGKALKHPEPTMHGTIDYLDLVSRYIKMVFSKHASFEERIELAGYVVNLLRRWRQFLKHGRHAHAGVGVNFLPRQTYEHVLLSCFSVVLKILAHAERGSEYQLALWLTGSNACEDAFSALGGFGRVLAMVRNFTFGGALESLSHQAIMEAYKVTGEDPLRFGTHRGHKQDIDMSYHEDVSAPPADLSGKGHPADFVDTYAAAWRRGDEQSMATAERRGMKPSAGAFGRMPGWWERPWESDGDLSDLREADADEMGDEVLKPGATDATGEPTGAPMDIEPDVTHPAITSHLMEEEAEEAASPQDEEERGEEINLSSTAVPEPPQQPRLYSLPPLANLAAPGEASEVGAADAEEEDDEAGSVPLDAATAARLEELIERAQISRQAEEVRQSGRRAQPKSKVRPTFTVPAEQGGGQVFKRSLVAELNRMRPGERLPVGRLEKMQVAARAMGEGKPKATKVAEAEEEAADEEAEAEAEEEERLARGVDFGMAFKGKGPRAKHVCWLGRVEKLFKPAGKSNRGKARTDSIELDELKGQGFRVLASWYVPCKQKRGRYKHNAITDSTVYSLDHLIGLVTLEYDEQNDEYVLDPLEEQLNSLEAATRRTEPADPTKSSGKTRGEVEEAEARRREQQQASYTRPSAETVATEKATAAQRRREAHDRRHGEAELPPTSAMVVADLRAELQRRGKDTSGLKATLVARLDRARRAALAKSASSSQAQGVPADETITAAAEAVTGAMEEMAGTAEAAVAVEMAEAAEAAGAVETVEAADSAEAAADEAEVTDAPGVANTAGAAADAPEAGLEAPSNLEDDDYEVVEVQGPPPPIEPLDDLRDLSGDAIRTAAMLQANRASGCSLGHPNYVFAQCSLSAARNLLRNEQLPRSFLVERQLHGAGNDTSEQPDGEIRFPDWAAILRPLLQEGEVHVQFDPTCIGPSELLHDLRLAACSYSSTTHVVAVFKHSLRVGGRVAFRRYDNDSPERLRGTYELTNATRLWTRCAMEGITREDSALHCAVKAFRLRPRENINLVSPPRPVGAARHAAPSGGGIGVDMDGLLMGMPME